MVVALGHAATGAMSNDKPSPTSSSRSRTRAANATGKCRCTRSTRPRQERDRRPAQLGGRAAGSLTAASFLKSFVGETPWIHLDIAGTAYLDSESSYLAKGPTGTPVRAFVAYAEAAAKTPPGGNGAVTTNGTVPKTATV